MRSRQPHHSTKGFWLDIGLYVFVGGVIWLSLFGTSGIKHIFKAIGLRYEKIASVPPASPLSESELQKLMASQNIDITSSTTQPIPETPPAPQKVPDASKLGYGKSFMIARTKWATVRHLGQSPAGAGLSGAALNQAQRNAFGKENDSIPTVTIASTLNEMMENYFQPMLRESDIGSRTLADIKINATWIAPNHPNTAEHKATNNAHVSHMCSIYFYHDSCHDSSGGCQRLTLSTGHDPSVIAHELAHCIYNHKRQGKILQGFQWFAVDEGLADYFSASFFNSPRIGEVWRANPAGRTYLRNISESISTKQAQYQGGKHVFGMIWSSTLWRIAGRLGAERGASKREFDTVVLNSIPHFGKSNAVRFGDAGRALLQAAKERGHTDWNDIIEAELERADISLVESNFESFAKKNVVFNQSEQAIKEENTCGSIGHAGQSLNTWIHFSVILSPFAWKALLKIFMLLQVLFLGGCKKKFSGEEHKGTQVSQFSQSLPYVSYSCSLSLASASDITPVDKDLAITFSWPASPPKDSEVLPLLISDHRFEQSPAALKALLDTTTGRLDSFRFLHNDKPFVLDKTEIYSDLVKARALRLTLFAKLLLSDLPKKVLESGGKGEVEAEFQSKRVYATTENPLSFPRLSGIPRKVVVKSEDSGQEETICEVLRHQK